MKLIIGTHDDDIELFAAFTLMREVAAGHNVTCVIALDSYVQQRRGLVIGSGQRQGETENAMAWLAMSYPYGYEKPIPIYRTGVPDSLGFADAQCRGVQDLTEMEEQLRSTLFARFDPEHVWAPAVEPDGNAHHNLVGRLAAETWPGRVTHYLSYTALGKSTNGKRVKIEQGEWIARKLRAMACHVSQMTKDPRCGCWPHFVRGIEEYTL